MGLLNTQQIEPISALELARLINSAMLGPDPPRGWLRFLHKYAVEYMIVQELAKSGALVQSVGLKTMNLLRERNHHIKPAQAFSEAEYEDKFSSERMKGRERPKEISQNRSITITVYAVKSQKRCRHS